MLIPDNLQVKQPADVRAMPSTTITVVTVTRGRPGLLKSRAIDSVGRQDVAARTEHLIVVDDCTETAHLLSSRKTGDATKVIYARRDRDEITGPSRLARLRSAAIREVQSDWICFLDDDNSWKRNHLRSLLTTCETSASLVAHSYLELFWADGRPYLEALVPWIHDLAESKREYLKRWQIGIVAPGSNIVKDRADALGCVNGAQTVDAGEWLIHRSVFEKCPYPTSISDRDQRARRGDDDVFLHGLLNSRFSIATTGMSTLQYYIGGFSTSRSMTDWL